MTYSAIDLSFISSKRHQADLGTEIHFFETVDSTNLCARRALADGAKHGSVFIANAQSQGRGRLGRSWLSVPSAGIYLSIILRPALAKEDCSKVSLVAGLAAVLAINRVCGVQATLKWPNDILLMGKKICGILSEFYSPAPDNYGIVVGVGINVHHNREHFQGDLEGLASSLEIETGRSQNRNDLIVAFLEELESQLSLLVAGSFEQVLNRWSDHCAMLGKEITISQGTSSFRGKALRLDEAGNLLLQTEDNEILTFSSGEASLK